MPPWRFRDRLSGQCRHHLRGAKKPRIFFEKIQKTVDTREKQFYILHNAICLLCPLYCSPRRRNRSTASTRGLSSEAWPGTEATCPGTAACPRQQMSDCQYRLFRKRSFASPAREIVLGKSVQINTQLRSTVSPWQPLPVLGCSCSGFGQPEYERPCDHAAGTRWL